MVDSEQFNAMLKSFENNVPKKPKRNRSHKKSILTNSQNKSTRRRSQKARAPKMDPNNTDYTRNRSKLHISQTQNQSGSRIMNKLKNMAKPNALPNISMRRKAPGQSKPKQNLTHVCTQQDVIDHIEISNKKYESKFITKDEREKRKNRGPPRVFPDDFQH